MSTGGTLWGTSLLYLPNGRELRIAERLGGGGEGDIYVIEGDPARVVKVYKQPTPERASKLRAMVTARPEDPSLTKRGLVSICWPEELVSNSARQVCGFTMPRIDVSSYHKLALLWNPDNRATAAPGFTWKHLCVAAANICSLMDLVHSRGHVIGDLNEENVLVNSSALAAVVDCDSMQVRDPAAGTIYRSPVCRAPYVPPERAGAKFGEVDRSMADDRWALAILLFAMLLEGQHPAHGIGYPPERNRRVRLGVFPYLGAHGFEPPRNSLPFGILPPMLQALFVRCLRDGHSAPQKRPSAAEWRSALKAVMGNLQGCGKSPLHMYSMHLPSCPWCADGERHGIDRFAVPSKPTAPAANTSAPAGPRAGSAFSVSSANAAPVQPQRPILDLIWSAARSIFS